MIHADAVPASQRKRVWTPESRTTLWYCAMTLLVGPFGLVLGPLTARWANRRVARLYPNADMAARARSRGYEFGQVSALVFCTIYALAGCVLLVPAMLTALMVLAG